MFSVYQIVFAILIASALYWGRPHPRIATAILANFGASVALSKMGLPNEALIWAGVLDTFTVVGLLGISWRGNVAAACYGFMVVIYPLAVMLDAPISTTYSGVEALGALALAVIGGLDQGIRILSRALYRAIGAARRRVGFAYRHSCGSIADEAAVQVVSKAGGR